VTNYGANSLYKNSGDGTFLDISAQAAIQGDDFSASAAFFDYDNDGDLDLYVSNYVVFDIKPLRQNPKLRDPCIYLGGLRVFCGPEGLPRGEDRLYRNEGDGTFADVTQQAGITSANSSYGLGVVPEDFDLDGDMDLFVANDERANVLWRNDGTHFANVAMLAGVAFNLDGEEEAGMGVDVGDYDGDGDGDIFVTNFYGETNTLYRNDGELNFVDATTNCGLAAPSVEYLGWGTRFFDADGDGDLDLFVANGHVYPQVDESSAGGGYAQRNQLFKNEGGTYAEVDGGPGLAAQAVSRSTASGDYDNDGDIDLLVTHVDAQPTLLRNDALGAGHSLWIELVGTDANRHGLGARIAVTVGGKTQVRTVNGAAGYLGANATRLHFGLGAATRAERVEVIWPGGNSTIVEEVVSGVRRIVESGGANDLR
jgi:predicted nucleotidyltransferase